jgi:hypothetical protein
LREAAVDTCTSRPASCCNEVRARMQFEERGGNMIEIKAATEIDASAEAV